MEILNKDLREATRQRFRELDGRVRLVHFTREPAKDCTFCREAKLMLEEVTGLSDKIELEVHDLEADRETAAAYGIDKVPATVIMGEEDLGLRIFGIPSGYEYQTLIDGIVDVSHRDSGSAEGTRLALRALDKDVRIQVFVTPTCPYCAAAVRRAHRFAIESPRIRGEMIESEEFPSLSDKYKVFGVPKTIVNETVQFEGVVTEDAFLANVLKAVSGT